MKIRSARTMHQVQFPKLPIKTESYDAQALKSATQENVGGKGASYSLSQVKYK